MVPVILPRPATAADELATVARAREYAEAAHSAATRRSYASVLKGFAAYCDHRGLRPLQATPQTVVLYVTELAGYAKLATIRRHLAGIAYAHRERGFESPTSHEIVRRVVQGVARSIGAAHLKKTAITLDDLRRMLLCIRGDDVKARRDRALLLLGFAGALRRSELAALEVADLSWSRVGLKLTIRRSKTDQTGQGAEIPIPFVADRALCAARAVREWIDIAGIADGALFRAFSVNHALTERRIDGRAVANLVKALARKAQLEGDFSAHSLRAGFCTSAAQARVGLDRIATVTRHRSLTVLCGYIRRANLFEDPVLTSIVAPQVQKGTAA